MKKDWKGALAVGAVALVFVVVRIARAEADPYEALRLYDGSWEVRISSPEKKLPDHLTNHCAKTGVFFSCEQELNGQSVALVVFQPTGKAGTGGQEYRNLGLPSDGSKPGDWGKLVIDGDTWTYSWTQKSGEKSVAYRNVNHFTGKDRIHFELQNMEDGTNWNTQLSGDEQRVK